MAYAIGTAVGTAVVRNRIRRRLRMILRDAAVVLPPGDYLIGVDRAAADASFSELSAMILHLVHRISERAPR